MTNLIARLNELADLMASVASEMQQAGKDDPAIAQHAQELLGASVMVETWISGLEDQNGTE